MSTTLIPNAVIAALIAGTLLPMPGAWVVHRFRGGVGSGGTSVLGAAFCVAVALALLLNARSPAELENIEHVLHGNLIFAAPGDVWRVSLALLILPPLAALQFRRGLRATSGLSALLGFLASLGGMLLAVSAGLHLPSSIEIASFLLLPLVACWRLSPLLALALTAALCWLAPQLAPKERELPPPAAAPAAPSAAAPASPAVPAIALSPSHHGSSIELRLFAMPAPEPDAVEVSWTLDVRRSIPPVQLPRTMWLVTTGCGVTDERVIVNDSSRLAPGDQLLTGGFMLRGTTSVGPVAGELWTGPRSAETSRPVPDATVYPSGAPAAHSH